MIEEVLALQKVTQEVSKIISPCLKRGEYKEILESARRYQAIESSHRNMIECVTESAKAHSEFLRAGINERIIHDGLKTSSTELNDDLKILYDSI